MSTVVMGRPNSGLNLRLSWRETISRMTLKELEKIIEERQDEIERAWEERFSG